jgi:hypothetical protein
MNMSRVALAAVVAWVVDGVYGFAVYGKALEGEFARYPGVFRPMEAVMGNLPLMLAGALVAMFAVAYIYAKGYEGGSGVQEGLRFGILMAVFLVGYVLVGNYVIMNVGRRISAYMAVAGVVEWIVVGITLGVVYKPVAAGKTVHV